MVRSKITLKSNNVTTQSNVSTVDTAIIDITVPRGFRYILTPETPVRMFLFTKQTATGTGTPQTISLTYDLVDSPNLIGLTGDVKVYDNNVEVTTGVTIDYSANTVAGTFGSGTPIEVYYLFIPAYIEIRKTNANKTIFETLLTDKLDKWVIVNQYDRRFVPVIQNQAFLEPEEHIEVRFKGIPIVSFDNEARALFELEVTANPR